VSLSAIPKVFRQFIFDRDKGRCRYDRLEQFGQAAVFHVNHIIPRSRGGPTEESNLVLQCPHCSLHKSDRLDGLDLVTGERLAVFHPLQQRWEDHFTLQDTGECTARTAIGRVTVEVLHMNDALPIVARRIQVQLGILKPGS
jgi:hypothetical protein